MSKFRSWVYAARLRTLPLSISGIIVGTAISHYQGFYNHSIFFLALLTTVAFQVTSNFANDYGDGVKGTDDDTRIGPKRALQSGLLSKADLKLGVIVSALISLAFSVLLIYMAFGFKMLPYAVIFLLLGILSIWAAIKYTVGGKAYGYKGLGDLAVFVFFGMLSVLGTLFLTVKTVGTSAVFPAAAIGFLSVGVLNLNNLRDVESDRIHGKNTLVVKMGFENGKRYHLILLVLAFLCFLVFGLWENLSLFGFTYLVAFVPIFIHLNKILKVREPSEIDPELKKLALSTFLVSLLFYISINYFF